MRQELQSKVAEGQRVSEECRNVMKGGRDEVHVFVYIGEREKAVGYGVTYCYRSHPYLADTDWL